VYDEERPLLDVLQDTQLAPLVNSEGPIANVAALVSSLARHGRDTASYEPAAGDAIRPYAVRSAASR
jgi:hypothetical protein